MRKNKLLINSFIGFFSQLIILALGFVVPKIIINNYGSDTNGVTNTITQVFSYIALLESGIGTASQNALYPCYKNNDKDGISLIMSISKKYYRRISLYYAIIVIVMSLFIPILLKTDVDYITIFFYIFFEGLTSLVGFYFTSVWRVFLDSSGKTYFTNIMNLLTKILQYGIKICLALIGLNIMFIQVGYFFVSLITLLIYYLYMKKKYSWINYDVNTNGIKLENKNSYLMAEISATVFSSTDMIVLSIFVSTALSSVYSIYNLVFSAISGLITSIYQSTKYKLGQTYSADVEIYKQTHNIFISFILGLSILIMSVCLWLTIPFVKLYTSDVKDINYIYKLLPLLFSIVNIFTLYRLIPNYIAGIAGYAKKIGYFSLAEAISNIILSIIFVQFWGIYGTILATIITLPFKVVYLFFLTEKTILKRSSLRMGIIVLSNLLIFALTVIFVQFYQFEIDSYLKLIFMGITLTFSYALIVFTINVIANNDLRKYIKLIINKRKNKMEEM